jgi:hypothetical protein
LYVKTVIELLAVAAVAVAVAVAGVNIGKSVVRDEKGEEA